MTADVRERAAKMVLNEGMAIIVWETGLPNGKSKGQM